MVHLLTVVRRDSIQDERWGEASGTSTAVSTGLRHHATLEHFIIIVVIIIIISSSNSSILFIYLSIYPRQKDHMASYKIGKSRYMMTYTVTQSEKLNKQMKWKNVHTKNKPNHNVTVNCNNLFLKAFTEVAETTSTDEEFHILTIWIDK